MIFELEYLKKITEFNQTQITDKDIDFLTKTKSISNTKDQFKRIYNLYSSEINSIEESKLILSELKEYAKYTFAIQLLHWLYFNEAFFNKPIKRLKIYYLQRFAGLKESELFALSDEEFDKIFKNTNIKNVFDLVVSLVYNEDETTQINDRKYIEYIMKLYYINYNQIIIITNDKKNKNGLVSFVHVTLDEITTTYWFGRAINFNKIEEVVKKLNPTSYKFEPKTRTHILEFISQLNIEEDVEEGE